MDVSHPGTLCGNVSDTSRPVMALPEAQKGPKKGTKNEIFIVLAVSSPEATLGAVVINIAEVEIWYILCAWYLQGAFTTLLEPPKGPVLSPEGPFGGLKLDF